MREGTISIGLTLENGEFRVQAVNTGNILRELRGDLVKTAESTKRLESHFTGFAGQFHRFVVNAASVRFALLDFRDVFLAFPTAIAKSTGEIERLTKLMEGLSKASTKVARQQEAIANTKLVFDIAQNAPFEVKTIADAFVKLKSGGIDPTNGSLQALIDSVSRFGGTSENLKRAAVAIQQMGGKGVVSMEELRQQLGEAVPNAIQLMALGAGKSMPEFVRLISKGTVESSDALSRMLLVMKIVNEGAARELLATLPGAFEQLKTRFELFKNAIGTSGFGDVLTSGIKEFSNFLNGSDAQQFARDIGQSLTKITESVISAISALIRYSDQILFAGKALLAIYVTSKFKDFFDFFGRGYTAIATSISNQRAEDEKRVAFSVRSNAQIVAAEQARHAAVSFAERKRHAEFTANQVTELAQSKAYLASIQADALARQNALNTRKNPVNGQFISRATADEYKASLERLGTHAAVAQAKIDRIQGSIVDSGRRSIEVIGNSSAAVVSATQKATVAVKALSVAQIAANTAMRVGASLYAAVGGGLGLITLALAAGVVAWLNYKSSVEKANDSLRRNRQIEAGRGTESDLKDAEKEQVGIKAKLRDLKIVGRNDTLKFQIFDETTKKDIVVGYDKYEQFLKSKDIELSQKVRQVKESLRKEDVRLDAEGIAFQIKNARDIQRKGFDDDTKAALDAIQQRGANPKNTKAQAKIAQLEFERVSSLKALEAIADINKQEIALTKKYEAEKKAGNVNAAESTKIVLDQLSTDKTAKLGEIKALNDLVSKETTILKSKGGEGDDAKLSKVQTKLAAIRAELAGLNAEFDKKGSGDLAKFLLEVKESKGAKLTPAETTEATQAFGDLAKVKEGLEVVKDSEAVLAKVTERVVALTEEAAGGTTELGRLEKQLVDLKIAAIGLDPVRAAKALINIDAIIAAKDELKEFERVADRLAVKNFAAELNGQADSIRAGLSRDPGAVARAAANRDIEAAAKKRDELIKKSPLEAAEANSAFRNREAAAWEQYARAIETPLQGLNATWQNVTLNMQQATANWAQDFLGTLNQLITTGKADWRGFLLKIVTDFSRIQLDKSLGNVVTNVFGKIGDALTSVINGGDLSAAFSGFSNIFGGVTEVAGKFGGALSEMTDKGVSESTIALIKSAFTTTTKVTVEQAATTALANLATAAYSAATSLQSLGGGAGGEAGGGGGIFGTLLGVAASYFGGSTSLGELGGSLGTTAFSEQSIQLASQTFGFAKGGIMTEFGSAPLRKYANGGIANSPQTALFGEGSQPEAYVPLPDGRSIPVTVSGAGGGGQSVVISIVVNNEKDGSSSETQNSSGDDSSTYRRLAERVKGIVREELVTQVRPGGLLYN